MEVQHLTRLSSSTRRGFLWRQRWCTVVVVVVVVFVNVVVVTVVVVFLYKEGVPVEAKVVGMGILCSQIKYYTLHLPYTILHLTPFTPVQY